MTDRIEDTSKRDPALHLALSWPKPGSRGEELTEYITGMESAGQRQLVNSDRLPAEGPMGSSVDDDLRALGFTLGDPDPDDPLFRPVTLPEGWRREGSDHAMWSYILDERGIRRVAVFYKAAFYDRKAHVSVINVGGEVASNAIYGDGPIQVPWEKLTDDEAGEVRKAAGEYLVRAEEYPDIQGVGDRADRAWALLEGP
jgi:hypothetical protein